MFENYLKIITEAKLFQQVALLLFAVFFLIRMFFVLFYWLRLLWAGRKNADSKSEPLSLILTVRNEEENIRAKLPAILNIKNCDFEVVAIDDFSQDNSLSVLGVLRKENQKLKVSSLNQETRFSAKLAQNIAIKGAKNDWVMTIPASVSDFGDDWLAKISLAAGENQNVVINYSNVIASKGFANLIYRIERFFQQTKSAGFLINRLPFVYFEENVAFRKNKYFELGGYGMKIKEPFANLELLVNIFIRKKQTALLFNSQTAIRNEEEIATIDYFELLKKSFRIEKHLSWIKRQMLHFENFSKLLFLPLVVFVIVLFTAIWPIVAVMVGIPVLMRVFIIKILQNRLNERKIFISSLIYELIVPYFKVVYRWHFNRRSRNQKWRSSF